MFKIYLSSINKLDLSNNLYDNFKSLNWTIQKGLYFDRGPSLFPHGLTMEIQFSSDKSFSLTSKRGLIYAIRYHLQKGVLVYGCYLSRNVKKHSKINYIKCMVF